MARRIHCGINIDLDNVHGSPTVDQLQVLGANWVRFPFEDNVDAPEPTSFPNYDDRVQRLHQAGIRILMILCYETYPGMPALDESDEVWDAYIRKFVRRCGQIAEHYGPQVQTYQIWNEPDLDPQPGYAPSVRAEVYGRLLRDACGAIKAVSPQATVVTAGLARGDPGYVQRMRAATGGILHADAVGVHPYGQRPTENWPRPDWGFGVLTDLVQRYHNVARKPIWITEVGTDDTTVQDPFPAQAFEALNDGLEEKVPYVFWFCWSDGMKPPYGLVDMSETKKASYLSFQQFAQLPYEELRVSVVDRFSVHRSDRRGHEVRYIIVHSTASPVGAPAENTLGYLVGPNERWVSAHELVLPGGRAYRLVPDEYAAHHCESESVFFPDGTPAHLANEITWGIEAYQVEGRPVGDEVLETTIERVAVACRRLGLGPERVLAHRDIDPERRSDPVGVDMDELREAVRARLEGLLPDRVALPTILLNEADAHQTLQFNPNFALQARIHADGFAPNSPEFDVEVGGVRYRVQRAEHLETGRVRAYYAEVPRWYNVRFVERP